MQILCKYAVDIGTNKINSTTGPSTCQASRRLPPFQDCKPYKGMPLPRASRCEWLDRKILNHSRRCTNHLPIHPK